VQHDDRIRLYRGDRHDQLVLAVRHAHMLSVVALGLIFIRQSRKNHGLIRSLRRRDGFLEQRLVKRVLLHVIAFRVYDIGITGEYRNCRLKFRRIDMGAAAALIARIFRKRTDNGNLFVPAKRKDIFIFQKDHAFAGRFPRELMMRLLIPLRFRLPVFRIAEHDVQNALDRRIEHCFLKASILYGLDNTGVVTSV